MNSMEKLIWNLEAKSIDIHSFNYSKERELCFINIFINKKDSYGWDDMFKRLNTSLNNLFQVMKRDEDMILYTIVFNQCDSDKEKYETAIDLLSECIIKEEYKSHSIFAGNNTFDIKLGVSCNNNCIHCVIKPNIFNIKNNSPDSVVLDSGIGMQCSLDLSYTQIIDILNKTSGINTYVLTGGEPTIRKDIVNIMKWLYYNRPNSQISIQTNGRNLSSMNLVKAIRRYSRNTSFAIAIHGLEDTHNFIVNNRKDTGNPFKETIQGIKNTQQIFGNEIRTEIVLSNQNINDIVDATKYQHEELGITYIGISYPHLSGFKSKDVKKIAPDLADVLKLLNDLNDYLKENNSLQIILEEVPFCIINQLDKEIYFKIFECRNRKDVRMNFMGSQADDFHQNWVNEHCKDSRCKSCLIYHECIGLWKESCSINKKHLKPILSVSSNMKKFLIENWGPEVLKNIESEVKEEC